MRDPRPTANLIRPVLKAAAEPGARVLGGIEIAIAAVAALVGGAVAGTVLAAAYLAFFAVSVWARRADASCGCFGESSTRPDLVHLAVVAAGAVAAGGAAVTATGGVVALAGDGLTGIATIGSATLAGALGVVALTTVPATRAAAVRRAVPLFDTTKATS